MTVWIPVGGRRFLPRKLCLCVCVSGVMYGPVGLCMGQWGNVWVIYGLVRQCVGQWVVYGPVG